ncbi:MAG: TIGR00266 family protein, partial [Spirulina sp. DLM2.Bin59]
MNYEIRYKPAFAAIFITLEPGERITAEAGAMASMDAGLTMTTQLMGGFIPALLRRLFGGESLFTNTFINRTSERKTLVLSQEMIGDIEVLQLGGDQAALCLEGGAYIASTSRIAISTRWAGFNSWLAGEGLFKLLVKSKGQGLVFFGGYGG